MVAGGPIVHPEIIGTGVDAKKIITVVAPNKLVNGDVYSTTVAPIIPGYGGIGAGLGEIPFVGGYPGVAGMPFESPIIPSFLEKAKTMLF